MFEKNPYEKDETLDIPDFVEDRTSTNSESIDMSIFKMSDDELYDDAEENEENYRDAKQKGPRKGSTSLVLCLIIIALLLITSVASLIYAFKQHSAYVKANTSYLQVLANEETYKKQLAEKDATIEALNQQIANNSSGKKDEAAGTMTYEITDGPVVFRTKPTRDRDDDTLFNNKHEANNGEKFQVFEVVTGTDDPDYTYARVGDNIYFCIGNSQETYAKKVNN
ncbi:MAG: hypothetical protein IJI44_03435 [Erysipelotrichaceae bacterium]|nr:hypothetical protein [Erysipelotrichaceae bacterium]